MCAGVMSRDRVACENRIRRTNAHIHDATHTTAAAAHQHEVYEHVVERHIYFISRLVTTY